MRLGSGSQYLILCVLQCTAMMVHDAFANEVPCPDEPAPVAVPEPSATDLAHARWMEGLYAAAGASNDPALQLVAGWWWLKDDTQDSRASALLRRAATNPELDAAGLWSLVDLCGPQRNWDWCEQAAWKERLLEMAPDNANSWLLQIEPQTSSDGQANWNTPANQVWLSKAASASSIATFQGAHAIALFEFALEYGERNPYPIPKPEDVEYESVRELLAQGLDVRAVNASTFAVFTPWTYLNSLSAVSEMCKDQWPDGTSDAQRTCHALAELAFTQPRNWLDLSIWTMLSRYRDEGMGQDDYENARVIANSRQSCELPIWMGARFARMSEATTRQYLEEFERFGEIAAMRRAAVRDYQQHPEDYDHNPAECPQPEFPDLDWALND